MEKLHALLPSVLPYFEAFIRLLDTSGLRYAILEVLRTAEVQEAYYAQGREPLDSVNAKRKKLGLYLLGEAEGKRIVTYARHSIHQDRRAADIVPVLEDGKIPWDYMKYQELWSRFGRLGTDAGLEWGGGKTWTPLLPCGMGFDPPHYQKTA
jgi:hypothetical protein